MEKTISSDFIRGHIDTIILRSLYDGCKHTLEIAAYIEEKSGNQYEAKQATLYSALKRLEKQKYVRPFWNDAPEGGRRRYFEVTEAGRKFADKNLSEWDFSRDVIDILVDEVPKQKVTALPAEPEIKKIDSDGVSENKAPEKPVSNENIPEDPALKRILEPDKTEVNYKQILSNLFNNSATETHATETKEENAAEPAPEENTVFNEEILIKSRKSGKTDFSDLIEKAEAEGYKIRVSTGKTEKIGGKVLINKLNLFAILAVFLLFLVETLIFSLIYKKYDVIAGYAYIIAIVIAAAPAVYFIIQYLKHPNLAKNNYNKSLLISVSIIIFNLLLIVFAIALLTDINFASPKQTALKIVFPIFLLFDVFAFFALRHFGAKNSYFLTK